MNQLNVSILEKNINAFSREHESNKLSNKSKILQNAYIRINNERQLTMLQYCEHTDFSNHSNHTSS
ncbi:MAG: hypothetical protein BGO70_01115 [Bacteroidetes bacterium 43-93]|nr:MAG: hypothetical protein BGO70_01115 [Bacteroidetes bacterium 43-93]